MKKLTAIILCLMMAAGVACAGSAPENPNVIGQQPEESAGAILTTTDRPQAEAPQESAQATPETPEPTPEPTETPTPEPTEAPTPEPTPEPTPQLVYGAPQSYKPTQKLKKTDLPVVYNMFKMNPKGKKEGRMFTFDLNGDGKAEKISFKLDYKRNRTTITAGKIIIKLKDGADLMYAMLIDLDPTTPYTDLVVSIDTGSDDYITIPLHIEKGKFVCGEALAAKPGVRLTSPDTRVLRAANGAPQLTLHRFGRGQAAYLSGFTYSPAAARMLLELLLYLTGADGTLAALCDHPLAEAAFFPADNTLAALNNSENEITTTVSCPAGKVTLTLAPLETKIVTIN